jgi:hypothetical protein
MGTQMSKTDCLAVSASGEAAKMLQQKLLDFLGAYANEAALTAISLQERKDGSMALVESGPSLWLYDADSTATASDVVLEPDDGVGRWFAVAGGAGGGSMILGVRCATAAALPANTRTANVLLANANGSINSAGIDGLTDIAVGELVLVKDEGTGANNGVYVVDILGGASAKWQLTRASVMDSSEDIVPSMLFAVSEGTENADTIWVLTADATITLNTTALTFVQVPNLVDLASTATSKGASLIGIEDSGSIITATDVEGALAENRTAIDAAEASLVTAHAELDTTHPGLPMMNRVRMLGAPGAIVEGDTVTIGADVYEFRSSTPPAGGTAGRIWVYQCADSAASRANLINAINGVVDAATITRDGTNTETVLASAGITTGDVVIQSADGIGGSVVPSAAVIVCAEALTTVTDIWDQANTYNGLAQATRQVAAVTVTLTAAMIAKGNLQVYCDFTPVSCVIVNRSRPQNEAYTITGDAVSLTLAGGGSPNNQAADVLDIIIFG